MTDRDFRDRLSYLHSLKFAFCQACQDDAYLARDRCTGTRLVLRRALVVAAVSALPGDDFAAIPVVYTAPGRPIAIEARSIVRVGAQPRRAEPWRDLAALQDHLLHHHVAIFTAGEYSELLEQRLGPIDLVITLDWSMWGLVTRMAPALRSPRSLLLAEAPEIERALLVDRACVVADLLNGGWGDPSYRAPGSANALQICASVLAQLLVPARGEPAAGSTVLDALLAVHGPRPAERCD